MIRFATCFAVEEKLMEILDHNGGLKSHKVRVTYPIDFNTSWYISLAKWVGFIKKLGLKAWKTFGHCHVNQSQLKYSIFELVMFSPFYTRKLHKFAFIFNMNLKA